MENYFTKQDLKDIYQAGLIIGYRDQPPSLFEDIIEDMRIKGEQMFSRKYLKDILMDIYKNDFLNLNGTKEEKIDYVIDNFYELTKNPRKASDIIKE